MSQIFRRVLETTDVDAESDFFALGGDSLLATRVLSAVARNYGVELTFDDFLLAPTPGALAKTSRAAGRMSVVVVGAGLAGLTAAADLAAGGAEVTVLEARDRVGGRTHGIEVAPGSWVDAGAAYLGDRHTELNALLAELGLKTTPTTMAGQSRFALGHGGRRPDRPLPAAERGRAGRDVRPARRADQGRPARRALADPAPSGWTPRPRPSGPRATCATPTPGCSSRCFSAR